MALLHLLLVALPALTLAQVVDDQFHHMAHSLFLETDYNRNGVIDRQEIDQSFNGHDANHDGRISRHEFVTYLTSHTDDPQLVNIAHSLYDVYDINGDHHTDHRDLDNFYALLDGNDDDLVSEVEFVGYWAIILQNITHHHG